MHPIIRRTPGLFRDHLALFVITGIGGLFMASVGAFGTDEIALPVRYLYWTAIMLAGGAIGAALSAGLDHRRWFAESTTRRVAALTLALSVPQTLVVWTASRLILGHGWDPRVLAPLFPAVMIVSAAVMTLDHVARRRPPPLAPRSAEPPRPRLLERLPLRLRGAEIYALQAEDHYLRVHTSAGSELLLLRLSDALNEVEGLDGARTHRSWWVAKAGVADASTVGRRGVLMLKTGVEAPISRTHVRSLREGGWL